MKSRRLARLLLICTLFVGVFGLAAQVGAAPLIATEPVQSQVVTVGGSVTFSVEASGEGALSYQWLRNGMPISGATGSTLTLNGVKYSDRGYYQVLVSDSTGTARSRAGFLNLVVQHVVAWGRNGEGQITVPAGLSNVVAIAAGSNHSLALKSDGSVVAWGDNSSGQSSVPAGLSNVVAIAGGHFHSNTRLSVACEKS